MGITSSTPANSGFGNSGGVIHYLDCTTGVLVLIAVDPEGFGQHLYKVYQRKKFSARPWYPFP
jgi:hypothetical protein